MGMWEGKTGRIQSFNQAKKFTIMKKGTCNFHCLYCDTLPVSCCFTYSCRTLLKTFFFFKRQILNSPHVRESGKFLLKKSEILGFEIRNTVQRIRNLTNDWNPEFKFPLTKTGIQYLESGIRNPESKTVLDSLIWSELNSLVKAILTCKWIDPDSLGNVTR